jgi:hypothetical protein
MKYDLAVAYRIYPGISKSPAVHSDDKYKMSEFCLASFKAALGDLKAKIWVLLDKCPPEYDELFLKYFDRQDLEFVRLHGIGNAKSFIKQIEILLGQSESDIVYFAEDDYYYFPNALQEACNLMKQVNVDFVTTYDHLDYYTHKLHDHPTKVTVSGNRHWRQSNSTCLTFMTNKKTLNRAQKTFKTYRFNNYDASIWLSLTKFRIFNPFVLIGSMFSGNNLLKTYLKCWFFGWRQNIFGKKYKLLSPIPTLSTHLEKTCLSPSINWDNYFK